LRAQVVGGREGGLKREMGGNGKVLAGGGGKLKNEKWVRNISRFNVERRTGRFFASSGEREYIVRMSGELQFVQDVKKTRPRSLFQKNSIDSSVVP